MRRDLGATISTNLSWSQHYANITIQAYKILGLLRRLFKSTHSIFMKKTLHLVLWNPESPMPRNYDVLKKRNTSCCSRESNIVSPNLYSTTTNPTTNPGLLSLKLLPLMMSLEISDIIFSISSYKNTQDHFNISSHVKFFSSSTRAPSNKKTNS